MNIQQRLQQLEQLKITKRDNRPPLLAEFIGDSGEPHAGDTYVPDDGVRGILYTYGDNPSTQRLNELQLKEYKQQAGL